MTEQLTAGEHCAGYGGLAMAVEAVFNARTVWFTEYEEAPSKILKHHWPDVPNYGDMTKVDWAAIPRVDIISGGTPCQDLSGAGKRKGMTEGTRSNLWVQMRESIAIIQPRYVVWENVRGAYSARAASASDKDMTESETYQFARLGNKIIALTEAIESTPENDEPDTYRSGLIQLRDRALEQQSRLLGEAGDGHLRALGRVLGDLSDLGYDCQWRGIRASDVGAPHGRFRVFILATRRGSPGDTADGGRDESAAHTGRSAESTGTPGGSDRVPADSADDGLQDERFAGGDEPGHGATRGDQGSSPDAVSEHRGERRVARSSEAPGRGASAVDSGCGGTHAAESCRHSTARGAVPADLWAGGRKGAARAAAASITRQALADTGCEVRSEIPGSAPEGEPSDQLAGSPEHSSADAESVGRGTRGTESAGLSGQPRIAGDRESLADTDDRGQADTERGESASDPEQPGAERDHGDSGDATGYLGHDGRGAEPGRGSGRSAEGEASADTVNPGRSQPGRGESDGDEGQPAASGDRGSSGDAGGDVGSNGSESSSGFGSGTSADRGDGVTTPESGSEALADAESIGRGVRHAVNVRPSAGSGDAPGDSGDGSDGASTGLPGEASPDTVSSGRGRDGAAQLPGASGDVAGDGEASPDSQGGAGGDSEQQHLRAERPPLSEPGERSGLDWGAYQGAITRWERVLGRDVPAPTEPTGRNNGQRLSSRFTEWMMGLPDGHVTAPEIGISRNDQLKACGNGVVPQQAAVALWDMLHGPYS